MKSREMTNPEPPHPFFHPVDEREVIPSFARSDQAYPIEDFEKNKKILDVVMVDCGNELYTFGIHPAKHKVDRMVRSMRKSLCASNQPPSTANLGRLGRLPVELLLDVLSHVDIATALRFRQVNRRAREVLGADKAYRTVMENALHVVFVMCSLRFTPYIRFDQLEALLLTDRCSHCGDFGRLLFMPTLARCCELCLSRDSAAFEAAVLGEKQLQLFHQLGQPFTIMYSRPHHIQILGEDSSKDRHWIAAAKMVPNSKEWDRTNMKKVHSNRTGYSLPFLHNNGTKLVSHNGRICNGCRTTARDYGIMAIIDRSSADQFHHMLSKRAYSSDGYFAHFKWCTPAQELWKHRR